MDFLKSIMIAASGLRAQSGRMRVISENIANADSTSRNPGGDPYRRQIPSFESHFDRKLDAKTVEMGRVLPDKSDFRTRFEPGHPAADQNGYVKLPNVNSLVEMTDLQQAQRSYQANLNVVSSTRSMVLKTLEILKA
ncbi:flagellar basal body rod protein FlgC [Cohaesibacter celericrescens]|uniref:Flagellar basal-body rod protein FlgC n=1 Tax=Cohaesibacter celericrescens TaxID=2067669 RepID=A0A2N5XWE3_9HYPH|nr:flagellar basal body rod protein FlgC [Cohaesibacter celericrescens]PLW78833.1 flagellar basal body rod protein FlgC [Cohaesibacter celericrescens]